LLLVNNLGWSSSTPCAGGAKTGLMSLFFGLPSLLYLVAAGGAVHHPWFITHSGVLNGARLNVAVYSIFDSSSTSATST
jgi:hypothetical protein